MQFNYFDTMLRAQKGYARMLEPICRKWDLTRNELDVLLFLANNPGKDRAVDIVNGRGMAKSHVSLSVANLETKGLLRRKENPEDRRTIRLEPTEAARGITAAGQEAQLCFFTRIHEGISPEELVQWQEVARKISKNIENLEKE